jgi:hypothetical protein
VAALQARAGGGEGSAPILVAYDPVLVRRRTGRRMVPDYAPRFIAGSFTRISLSAGFIRREPVPCLYRRVNSGAQGKHRDGPPSQPAGTGSDALAPEGKGGEIARSVPAEIRARAQSAYEQAYTRAYRAYLGASPALGDPTATPRAGCGWQQERWWSHETIPGRGPVGIYPCCEYQVAPPIDVRWYTCHGRMYELERVECSYDHGYVWAPSESCHIKWASCGGKVVTRVDCTAYFNCPSVCGSPESFERTIYFRTFPRPTRRCTAACENVP